jgi:ABC-2 type transport system ATP-binding protein
MSLGMKQKVLIAVAIASGAEFLIFDEPLNALDIENIDLVTNVFLTLKNQGRTILLSSHNIFESSKICDEIFFLVDGSLKEAPLEYTQIKQFYFENFL